MTIRVITDSDTLRQSVAVIREAFAGVAAEFGLTQENCPTNPAFMTRERLESLREKGARFFGLYRSRRQIGFVAIEKAVDSAVFYLEKLSVLPEHRHKGYGKKLVAVACEHAAAESAKAVSIGIMDNHLILKEWYKELGFRETGTQQFPHLPFDVCFMEKLLEGADLERA